MRLPRPPRIRLSTFPAALLSASLFLTACAPSKQGIQFSPANPLIAQRIGVFYDQRVIGTFQGLDPRDSREYLTGLCAALVRNAGNSIFVDMTQGGAKIQGYQTCTVKKAEGLGDTTAYAYLVPKPGALGGFEDSLDFVLMFQNLSATKEVVSDFTLEERTFPVDPFAKLGGPASLMKLTMPIFKVLERDSQVVTHLGYVLWDLKGGRAIASEGKSLAKQQFMDQSTTFAEDAEVTSRRILKEIDRSLIYGPKQAVGTGTTSNRGERP